MINLNHLYTPTQKLFLEEAGHAFFSEIVARKDFDPCKEYVVYRKRGFEPFRIHGSKLEIMAQKEKAYLFDQLTHDSFAKIATCKSRLKREEDQAFDQAFQFKIYLKASPNSK